MKTLSELIVEYQEIRKKHGDKAASSKWLELNGYNSLYIQVRKSKIGWETFRKRAGFSESLIKKRPDYSIKDLRRIYRDIVKKHGDKAKSCHWLRENSYVWLFYQVVKKNKINWEKFKGMSGYKELPLEVPLKTLIVEYKKIRKKHGSKADSTTWMQKNGYQWLRNRVLHKKWIGILSRKKQDLKRY